MAQKKVRWTQSIDIEELATSCGPECVRELKTEDLWVAYQPIVNLQNGEIYAHEALARCHKESFKNPEKLFEQAVREGYTGRLGRMVRENACANFRGARLFVNVHPKELTTRWLVRPDDPMNYCSFPLFVEITETATFEHFDLCMHVLKDIVARTGAHLVVDDFAAGYSNLKRIIELEPEIVKLDRELVTGLDQSRRQQILVRDLVRMFGDLNATVVAEGIETEAELMAARDCGAQLGQGYFLSRPQFPMPSRIDWPVMKPG